MIALQNVSVSVDEAVLLAPTSLAVPPGTMHVIRGPNGSGKSTLLAVAAGILPATSGTAAVAGMVPEERNIAFRRRVAAVLGGAPSARDLTLHEQLAIVAQTWSASDPDADADGALAAWDIEHLRDRFPHELSSGQRQLFTLSLAWVRPADVLLLDEPEQRLDGDRRDLLVGRLAERRDAGCTMLIATHADVVEAVADANTTLIA